MRYLILILTITSVNMFGQTWENIFKPEQDRYFELLKDKEKTYLLTHDDLKLVIFRTTDDGVSWNKIQENKNSGSIEYFSVTADITEEGYIYVPMGKTGRITKFGFDPNTFLETNVDTEELISTIKMKNNDIGIAGNETELFLTENSWINSTKIAVEGLVSVWYSSDNSISYISYDEAIGSSFNRSIDKGESWKTELISDFQAEKLYFIDENIGFIIGTRINAEATPITYTDLIFRTTNAGVSWSEVLSKENENLSSIIEISFDNPKVGIVSGVLQSTYITYDSGLNWEKQIFKEFEEEVNFATCGFTRSNFLVAVRDYGVYSLKEPLLSVESNELLSEKYSFKLEGDNIIFDKTEQKQYKISDLNGRLLEVGTAYQEIKLENLQNRQLLINLNSEYTIKIMH